MLVGIPKEIKNHEYRVALTPVGARELVLAGHSVRIEAGAGAGIGIADQAYREVGAEVVSSVEKVYAAELVVKVKEPQESEIALLQAGQILFCYLHLAAAPQLARSLMERNVTAIGFETVTDSQGSFPLLAPMSEIAGRIAPQMGALGLMKAHGGSGTLVNGIPGVPPAQVVVVGGGTVGLNAARVAIGLGARVRLLDRNVHKLRRAEERFGSLLETAFSSPHELENSLMNADMVIGAAMVAGRRTPRLITRAHLRAMRPGSVLVDVAIDQGGMAETSRPTTHSAPFYVEEGIVHYCVANMPGAVAKTATLSLAHATLPYVLALARLGMAAVETDPQLRSGLQIHHGNIFYPGLAEDIALRNI